MKKIVLLLAICLCSVSVAHASLADWMDSCFDLNDTSVSDSAGCTFFMLSLTTFFPVMVPATSSTSAISGDDKEAYINEVRDESAAFIAEDGAVPASAVLKDAILAVRALDSATQGQSDLVVARELMQ